jgi:hypothetical protein
MTKRKSRKYDVSRRFDDREKIANSGDVRIIQNVDPQLKIATSSQSSHLPAGKLIANQHLNYF